jgi:hypothetical protein
VGILAKKIKILRKTREGLMINKQGNGMNEQADCLECVISNTSDEAANNLNILMIDRLINTRKYVHIVAWGKFLGFTPATVGKYIAEAEADRSPDDSIQKINGKWLRLGDILNRSNRERVAELAKHSD